MKNCNQGLPLISIITVVYNGDKYLEQTITSVINQTYKNVEYIIIDGGSTDGTLSIIEKYKQYISYFVSEPDHGLYDAMNKGIKSAKGDLIGMINSDDWYEINAVQLMVNAYLDNPDKAIFHADRFDVGDDMSKVVRPYNSSEFKFIYYGMTYNHPSMFIARSEYEKHLYNTDLRALSDYQFVLEAYLNNKNTFFYVKETLVNYRLEGISTQMTFLDVMKEGYVSREKAGLKFFDNMSSVFVRCFMFLIYKNILKFKQLLRS